MRKLKPDELERITPDEHRHSKKQPFLFVLDNVRSAVNVGAVFRTADAMNVSAVYLCGITACPPHRDINKTALGAAETVEWKFFGNTLEAVDTLKKDGYLLVAVEQTTQSVPLQAWDPVPDRRLAFVFGNEVKGVDEEVISRCDAAVAIPQWGTKHSLNVAVCAGILAWEMTTRFMGLKKKAP